MIGRTNMTEFAFSGLGTNAHYGDARCPFERDPNDITKGRVAGGSSSGSAVSISDGMAPATIGSDTGGSTRAPAAFCGIVGLKPTTTRMPSDGIFPLSRSFDAAGPMANTVSCCAILDSLMAGGSGEDEAAFCGKRPSACPPKRDIYSTILTRMSPAALPRQLTGYLLREPISAISPLPKSKPCAQATTSKALLLPRLIIFINQILKLARATNMTR